MISQIVTEIIKGIQKNAVAACANHFMANNQEVNHFEVDVDMDERALHEIHSLGFKAAVKEGILNIMGANNPFKGYLCSLVHIL